MKRVIIIAVSFAILIAAFLLIYPIIELDTGEKLIRCSYTDDFSEYDINHSYNEVYCYNEKHDVSIKNFETKKFWFFYTIHMKYVKGDERETEFILEEAYIENFIKNAKIEDNVNNIDIATLIDGKKAIVGNTRYTGNDYENGIYYTLDGEYEEMYVFSKDGLLIIQVGSPDENPRFIAYK